MALLSASFEGMLMAAPRQTDNQRGWTTQESARHTVQTSPQEKAAPQTKAMVVSPPPWRMSGSGSNNASILFPEKKDSYSRVHRVCFLWASSPSSVRLFPCAQSCLSGNSPVFLPWRGQLCGPITPPICLPCWSIVNQPLDKPQVFTLEAFGVSYHVLPSRTSLLPHYKNVPWWSLLAQIIFSSNTISARCVYLRAFKVPVNLCRSHVWRVSFSFSACIHQPCRIVPLAAKNTESRSQNSHKIEHLKKLITTYMMQMWIFITSCPLD